VERWKAVAESHYRDAVEATARRKAAEAELAAAQALIRAVADTPMSLDVLDSPVIRRVGAYAAAHPEEGL
jgi:hypothetical protein